MLEATGTPVAPLRELPTTQRVVGAAVPGRGQLVATRRPVCRLAGCHEPARPSTGFSSERCEELYFALKDKGGHG